MREPFVFAHFLYNARDVPSQLNKHCSVTRSVKQFFQLVDEDGPSSETRSEAIFIYHSLIAKKVFSKIPEAVKFKQKSLI